jgi:hypothetical protein
MRVRHRWLLLSVFVATIVIVLTTLGSNRTVHPSPWISFLGYTNLPDAKVRSAVFVVHRDRLASTSLGRIWIESAELQDGRPIEVLANYHQLSPHGWEAEDSWSFAIDEPSECVRWRISWHVNHLRPRFKVAQYAEKHRLLPRTWLVWLYAPGPSRGWNYFTTSSVAWLTNSPSPQKQQ